MTKEKTHLVGVAVQEAGFKFHHAKDDYILMTKWLQKEMQNKMPHFASHYCGVGGVVINKDRTKVLCVQERTSWMLKMWKFPGGLAEKGEYI